MGLYILQNCEGKMIVRVEKNENYTMMANFHLRDRELSLKAKGLLSYMLSCIDDWDFSVAGLTAVLKEGRDSIRATLDELERFGYLTREQHRNSDGSFGKTEFVVHEQPKIVEKGEMLPCTEKPSTVKAKTDKPKSEKTTQRSPKVRSTKNKVIKDSNLSTRKTREALKKQICYEEFDNLIEKGQVDDIISIMTELLLLAEQGNDIWIGKTNYPNDLIIDKLSAVTKAHIEYVLDAMKKHSDKIENIKAYLRVTILNAVDTMDSYYLAEASYDMKRR